MTETVPAPPRDLPAAVDFQEASDGIECYRLVDNDLRILLLPQDGAPVATSMVTYHVGSRNERTGHTGATHMLEHLARPHELLRNAPHRAPAARPRH